MNVKPLFDKVVVKATKKEETTKSGFFIPSSSQEKSQTALVVAVGPGKVNDNGDFIKMQVKEGDVVLYSKYAGNEFKIDGEELTIISQNDILAIVE